MLSAEPTRLSLLFRPSFLERFAASQHTQALRNALRGYELSPPRPEETLQDFLCRAYDYMYHRCRSEYVYKNEIVRKLFLARHDPANATVLSEQVVAGGKGRVDLLAINAATTAYEIKTEYDGDARLQAQTELSLRLFAYVNIVCPESWGSAVANTVDERCGIIVMRPQGTFRTLRVARGNANELDPMTVMLSMRMVEVAAAIKLYTGIDAPRTVSAYERHEYLQRFTKLPRPVVHRSFLKALRERYIRVGDALRLHELPAALLQLYYETKPSLRGRLMSTRLLGHTLVGGLENSISGG